MILYTVAGKAGAQRYLDIKNSGDLRGKSIYVNMTNRCPCNCTFCLRQSKELLEGNSLWLSEGEPKAGDVIALFLEYDLSVVNEVVFCGFGEPLERLYDVCEVIDGIKERYPDLKFRLNTVGLANLMYKKDITPMLSGRFNTVSISLNATNREDFLALTRSSFGIGSYDALKDFAVRAREQVETVVLTVVDKVMSEEEIEICRGIADELSVSFRVREYEEG